MLRREREGGCIASEADKLFKSLLNYAKVKRDEGVYDFTEILAGFYKRLLNHGYDNEANSKNAFTKRFMKLVKEYVETDPRYQSKMDSYYET
ncbi:MAG: hypothetical protein QW193_04380 [Nitrososphaerales archaeon]